MDLSDCDRCWHQLDEFSLIVILFGICACPKFQERMFSGEKKTPAASWTPLKKAWGQGTGDRGQYNTISPISPPTPPHAGRGGGHGVGILRILYCIVLVAIVFALVAALVSLVWARAHWAPWARAQLGPHHLGGWGGEEDNRSGLGV